MLARIALYSTLGYLCNSLGYKWNSYEFWCFLGLFWSAELLARQEVWSSIEAEVIALHKQQEVDKDKDS